MVGMARWACDVAKNVLASTMDNAGLQLVGRSKYPVSGFCTLPSCEGYSPRLARGRGSWGRRCILQASSSGHDARLYTAMITAIRASRGYGHRSGSDLEQVSSRWTIWKYRRDPASDGLSRVAISFCGVDFYSFGHGL